RREIAVAEACDRHTAQIGLGLAYSLSFVVDEEKETVLAIEQLGNLHRATQIEPELVQLERRNRVLCGIEEVFCIQLRVTKKFVSYAVVIIGSRLIGDINNSLPSAISCRGGTRLHAELVNRIDRRKKNQYTRVGIHAVDTVDQISNVF